MLKSTMISSTASKSQPTLVFSSLSSKLRSLNQTRLVKYKAQLLLLVSFSRLTSHLQKIKLSNLATFKQSILSNKSLQLHLPGLCWAIRPSKTLLIPSTWKNIRFPLTHSLRTKMLSTSPLSTKEMAAKEKLRGTSSKLLWLETKSKLTE